MAQGKQPAVVSKPTPVDVEKGIVVSDADLPEYGRGCTIIILPPSSSSSIKHKVGAIQLPHS